MKFLIKKTENLKQQIIITIPAVTIQKKIQLEINEINKTTVIKGFRKGKVPKNLIKKYYQTEIVNNILKNIMNYYFQKIIKEKKIDVVNIINIYACKYELDKDFIYNVKFEVYPNIRLNNITQKKITELDIYITSNNIKSLIKKHNTKDVYWEKSHKNISNGDLVTINYKVIMDNRNITKYKKNNYSFIIGNNNLIPEINKNLINKTVHNVYNINIQFSNIHPENDLRGQCAILRVYINNIKTKKEFKKNFLNTEHQINKSKKNDRSLYKLYYQNIKEKIKTITNEYLKFQILSVLLQNNSIEIPHSLYVNELNILLTNIYNHYKKNEKNILIFYDENQLKTALKNKIKFNLLLKKVISVYSLKIDNNLFNTLLHKIAYTYKNPKEIIKLYYNNKHLLNNLYKYTLEEQFFNIFLKQVTLIKKKCSFQKSIQISKKINIFNTNY